MYGKKEFDLWADEYDRSVEISEEKNTYPFAGYGDVLKGICETVMKRKDAAILDLGFGTAVLTAKLYEDGCRVFGQDFSSAMIRIASEKMPEACLFEGDFSKGLADPLKERDYDFIIATYALHHLDDDQKKSLLRDLLNRLKEDGKILIGDVMFEDAQEMERCRLEAGEEWDEDEIYFLIDETRKWFPDLVFEKKSFCSGIITIPK